MAELVIRPLTRIYGNAALRVESEEGATPRARFSAFGYRGFELMARGAHVDNLVPMVSRICGPDSLFHQAAACMAAEEALGVQVPPAARTLRELALWAQLFERHAVSLALHSLPDLLFPASDPGLRNLVSIYRVDEEVVRRLLSLKSLGTAVLREVGGRQVHGFNFRPGGAIRDLRPESRESLAERLRSGEALLLETARLVKLLLRRSEERVRTAGSIDGSYLAMRHPRGVEIGEGEPALFVTGEEGGEPRPVVDLGSRLREEPSAHGHVVYASLEGAGELRVGPLARLNVNGSYGTPRADDELVEVKETWGFPVRYPMVAHALRMLEMIHAWEKMLALLSGPAEGPLGGGLSVGAGKARAYLEAPEGALVYGLELGEDGLVRDLSIISPLQFNLRSLERSLAEAYAATVREGVEKTADVLQMVVRAYAPCVPCGVH
ncbi:nickel-dependent hydrogenase large subunit [Candidatus Solincola tengchongensis]|uniref:nickel-dependent hydrogenase large subunit n=1 Tax=Candidatus Solincola tengchongensis TaxID=2900693 RepID=UPI0025808D77|nr:nickel-dependent hydrogenase large subunit [Candidatus Solincola tengchongensis]